MDTRYQIEEMLSQDEKGVVFQGTDSVTGVIVAMRRFISSGGSDGSFNEKERAAYGDVIAVLKKVAHPSLRRVLAGGCDPVDEMPYLVTRWIGGATPLADLLASQETFDSSFARHILGQLLQTNTAMQQALGREGLWIELVLDSMTLKPSREEGEPPVALFWLCPWRWRNTERSGDDLMALAALAEAMLGGPRKMANVNPDDELVKWIGKLRSNEFANLQEAQAALQIPTTVANPFIADVESTQADPPGELNEDNDSGENSDLFDSGFNPLENLNAPSRPSPPSRAVLPSEPKGQKGIRTGMITAAVVVVLGLFVYISWPAGDRQQDESLQAAKSSPSIPANPVSHTMLSQVGTENSATNERRQHVQRRGYYTIQEGDLLFAQDQQEVTLRGRLVRVRMSGSGRTMYLDFSEEAPMEEPRAYAMTADLVNGIHAQDLEPLIGRTIEIRGPVDIEQIGDSYRPRVKILDRGQIHVLEADEDYELR